jgi:hypothetical protein
MNIDKLIADNNGDKIVTAKIVVVSYLSGNRSKHETGYGPTSATILAMEDVHISIGNPQRARIFAHALGYHDAILRDGSGYKVPDVVGKDYEEGHSIGAAMMVGDSIAVMPAPREDQGNG